MGIAVTSGVGAVDVGVAVVGEAVVGPVVGDVDGRQASVHVEGHASLIKATSVFEITNVSFKRSTHVPIKSASGRLLKVEQSEVPGKAASVSTIVNVGSSTHESVGAPVVGKLLVGKLLVGELLVGKLLVGKLLVGELLVGELLVGELVVGESVGLVVGPVEGLAVGLVVSQISPSTHSHVQLLGQFSLTCAANSAGSVA